jgi:hypothetical protein
MVWRYARVWSVAQITQLSIIKAGLSSMFCLNSSCNNMNMQHLPKPEALQKALTTQQMQK